MPGNPTVDVQTFLKPSLATATTSPCSTRPLRTWAAVLGSSSTMRMRMTVRVCARPRTRRSQKDFKTVMRRSIACPGRRPNVSTMIRLTIPPVTRASLLASMAEFIESLNIASLVAAVASATLMEAPAWGAPVAASPPVAVCAACHGAQGEGGPAGAPRLAGQDARYLEHALKMFKDGSRTNATMQPIAASLSDAERHELAVYFSSLDSTPTLASTPPPSALAEAGRVLAQTGDPANSTPACFTCHGSDGGGVAPRVPAIAAEPLRFTVDRLHEFQARARASQPAPASMTAVSARLTEAQIEQVAAYLSTLAPPQSIAHRIDQESRPAAPRQP